MGIQIEDGKGRGFTAQVDSEGHFVVDALTLTDMAHTSEEHGLAFAWASQTYDPDAGDTILLVKNTSSTRKLFIKGITLSCDTDTRVIIHLPTTEVTPTGTTIVGVNLNTNSNNVAETTAIRDETNNTQGDVIWSGEIHAAQNPVQPELFGSIILGQNKSIGVDFVSASTAGDVTIVGYLE